MQKKTKMLSYCAQTLLHNRPEICNSLLRNKANFISIKDKLN
jgi:hypothetical protein